jgi:hypothetical protein
MAIIALLLTAIAAIPGVIALSRLNMDKKDSSRRLTALETQAEAQREQTEELRALVGLARQSQAEEQRDRKRATMPRFVAADYEPGATINGPMTHLLRNDGEHGILISVEPVGDEHFNYVRTGNAAVPKGEMLKVTITPRGATVEERNNVWSQQRAHFTIIFEDAHRNRYSQEWDVKAGKFGDPYSVLEL